MKTNIANVSPKRNALLIFIVAVVILAVVLIATHTGFTITGKWKNIGNTSFGQISPGGILVFDGTYCNLYSPKDTYAYTDGSDTGTLDISSFLFGEHLSFEVQKVSRNRIKIKCGSVVLEFERVS